MSFFAGLFGGGKSKVSQLPTRVETVKTPTVDDAAKSAQTELDRQRRAAGSGGRGSTILTANDSLEGTPVKKTVLGAGG